MTDLNIPWRDWKAVRRIGNGSFGSVYEIERQDGFGHTEKAALKVISIPKEESEIDSLMANGYDANSITEYFRTSLNNIMNEYAMMAALKSHSNIVSCEDRTAVRKANGIGWDVYIRMELLTPFTKEIKEKEISVEETVKVGKDLLKAISACHEKKIIHRDIKPENIFVTEYGEYKLGDFGVARIMSHTTNATKTGTPYYMAPEVDNNEKYGKEADIYSLGMVLYWLLNNRRLPFEPTDHLPLPSEKDKAYKTRISGKEVPEPLNGSSELKKVIRKALAYDPKKRYRTAEEMLNAIDSIQNNAGKESKMKPELDLKNIIGKVTRQGNSKKETTSSKLSAEPAECAETIGNPWKKRYETTGHADSRDTEKSKSSSISNDVYDKNQSAYSSVREKPNLVSHPKTGLLSDNLIKQHESKFREPEFAIYEDRPAQYQGSIGNGVKAGNNTNETLHTKPSDKAADYSETASNLWKKSNETTGHADSRNTKRNKSSSISDDVYDKNQSAYSSVREKPNLVSHPKTGLPSDNLIKQHESKSGEPEFVIYGDRLVQYQGNNRNVVIPSIVKVLQKNVFKECTALQKVTIPKGIRVIPTGAFDGCVNLEEVVLPEGLETIEKYAFRGCEKLKYIILPASTEFIGEDAFTAKDSLDFGAMFRKLSRNKKNLVIESPWLALKYHTVAQTRTKDKEDEVIRRILLLAYFLGWISYLFIVCYRCFVEHMFIDEESKYLVGFCCFFIIVGLIKMYNKKEEGAIYVLSNLFYGLGLFYVIFIWIGIVVVFLLRRI